MVQWPSPVRADALRAVLCLRRRCKCGLFQRNGEYFKGFSFIDKSDLIQIILDTKPQHGPISDTKSYPKILSGSRCTKICPKILGGAATCSEGFVTCFLKVSLVSLGSMAAAVQPNSLGNSQKRVNKTFGTSDRPTRYSLRQRGVKLPFQPTIANLRENIVLNADFNSSFRAGENEQHKQYELFSTPS